MLGVSCTIAVSTIVLLSRYYLFRMFNSELEVIQCGIQILMITAPVYFIYVAIEVLSGTVRGAGASFIPMVISISHLCILRIILLAIIVPLWNSVQAIAIVYQLHGLLPPLVYLFTINVFDGEIRLSRYSVINLFLWNKNKESDCFDRRHFTI